MKFENVTIELNGIKEIVFNRTTVWVPATKGDRWLKYKIVTPENQKQNAIQYSVQHGKPIGGMSKLEMHEILHDHMRLPTSTLFRRAVQR